MTLERIPLIWTSSIQFSEKVIFLSFKSSKVKIQLLWDINPILSCFFWSITWYRIWDVMSLFLYLFFIPNKRSVGITHTKYYRTCFYSYIPVINVNFKSIYYYHAWQIEGVYVSKNEFVWLFFDCHRMITIFFISYLYEMLVYKEIWVTS